MKCPPRSRTQYIYQLLENGKYKNMEMSWRLFTPVIFSADGIILQR